MNHHQPRVLVVDDEPAIRQLIREFLASHDLDCAVAEDAEHAIHETQAGNFDVVIMDVRLPGVSGMEALRQIKAQAPDQQVIMVTGLSEVETAAEAMRLGALDYMRKPLVLQDMLAKVDEALRRGVSRHQAADIRHMAPTPLPTPSTARADHDRWAELRWEVERLAEQVRAIQELVDRAAGPEEPPPGQPAAGRPLSASEAILSLLRSHAA